MVPCHLIRAESGAGFWKLTAGIESRVVFKGVSTIEATDAAASVVSSASYILEDTTTLIVQLACHEKFVQC